MQLCWLVWLAWSLVFALAVCSFVLGVLDNLRQYGGQSVGKGSCPLVLTVCGDVCYIRFWIGRKKKVNGAFDARGYIF